jgi:DNA-directed RNA polymerase subunit RPC12/RpoP
MAKSVAAPSPGYLCYRCGWRWMPRKADYPKVCPRCHSSRWYDDKTDDDLYWHWLEWAVGMYWFDVFRFVAKVSKGEAGDVEAKALIRKITDKAVSRVKDERPSWKRHRESPSASSRNTSHTRSRTSAPS